MNTNGNVNIPSLSPTMKLFVDLEGATIDLEYNRDTNKAINESGGNIVVDSVLDGNSENPVQNKVIYEAILGLFAIILRMVLMFLQNSLSHEC